MKINFRTLILLILPLTLCMISGCDEEDDKYASKLPDFEDIIFEPSNISVGTLVKATVVENNKGKNIYEPIYQWYWKDDFHQEEIVPKYNPSGQPVCEFTPSTPGNYTLVFKGKYSVSGRSLGHGERFVHKSGCTIKYTYSDLWGYVEIEKTFRTFSNK